MRKKDNEFKLSKKRSLKIYYCKGLIKLIEGYVHTVYTLYTMMDSRPTIGGKERP